MPSGLGTAFEQGAWRLTTWGTYEKRTEFFIKSDRESNLTRETVKIYQAYLDLEYNLSTDLSASLTFSYLDIFQEVKVLNSRKRVRGLGDTILYFHWNPLATFYAEPPQEEEEEENSEGAKALDETAVEELEEKSLFHDPILSLVIDLGLSLPTGSAKKPASNPGGTPFSALQTSTGTFNPMLGAHFRMDWGLIGTALDAVASIPVYENRFKLQTGTFQNYTVTLDAYPVDDLRLAVGFDFEHRAPDKFDGHSTRVGGGWRYVLHPQVVVTPVDGWHFFFGASLPVYRKFDTQQLDADVRWEFGFQVNF